MYSRLQNYLLQIDAATQIAKKELSGTPIKAVQIETAIKWCGRALAARAMRRREDSHEYAHEALEHAALTGDDAVLKAVQTALEREGIEY